MFVSFLELWNISGDNAAIWPMVAELQAPPSLSAGMAASIEAGHEALVALATVTGVTVKIDIRVERVRFRGDEPHRLAAGSAQTTPRAGWRGWRRRGGRIGLWHRTAGN